MPIMTVGTGASLIRGHYHEKVLATQPIAYWPLCEAAGTTARCLVKPAQNGTYSSDVSGWPPGTGIGDGNSAPYFDGTNDYVDIFSATLAAAFNGAEGSLASWQRVANVGVWTDGISRWVVNFRRAAADYINVLKPGNNNRFDQYYNAGGVALSRLNAGLTTTAWFHQAFTWSASADEVRYYFNGVWVETDNGLGVWLGPTVNNATVIGSRFVPVANAWHGWIQHVVVWDRPLAASEIPALTRGFVLP